MPHYDAKTEHLHRDGASRADFARIQRQGQSLHRNGERSADCAPQTAQATASTEHASRQREQGRLCSATAEQQQRHIMHRDGESSADYARIQQCNGSDRASASRRPEQCHCKDTTAGTECIATARAARTAAQRQRQSDRDASHRPEQGRLSLRRSNGSDRTCIATETARAAQTMRGHNGAMAQTCIGTASAAQTMHMGTAKQR